MGANIPMPAWPLWWFVQTLHAWPARSKSGWSCSQDSAVIPKQKQDIGIFGTNTKFLMDAIRKISLYISEQERNKKVTLFESCYTETENKIRQ